MRHHHRPNVEDHVASATEKDMTDGDVHKVKFELGINKATCAFTNENSFTLIEQRLLFSSVSVGTCECVCVCVFACNCACVCMCMCMCMSASAILDTERESIGISCNGCLLS